MVVLLPWLVGRHRSAVQVSVGLLKMLDSVVDGA